VHLVSSEHIVSALPPEADWRAGAYEQLGFEMTVRLRVFWVLFVRCLVMGST